MRIRSRVAVTGRSAVVLSLLLAAAVFLPACADGAKTGDGTFSAEPHRWWKGNLHTHSLWSDGDHYPEMVGDWYKRNGYHFLSLTDHNILSEGDRWLDVAKSRGEPGALKACRDRFGKDHLEERTNDGKLMVRLRTLEEIRPLLEEPQRFCLIQGEEITDEFKSTPVHVNAINLKRRIRPQQGKSIIETIKRDTLIVASQSDRRATPMLAILNHPNWKRSLTAEDIIAAPCVRFFELYNGGVTVRNYGDARQASTERVWDIVLTHRLAKKDGPLLYGVGADDTHSVAKMGPDKASPGRTWVVVRAKTLSPDEIVRAMQAGDFYTSTGVRLKDVRFDGKVLRIEIEPENDVTYTTRFIGSRKGVDLSSTPVKDESGKSIRATRRYGKDVGCVLSEVKGTSASYTLAGDELYVRAKVISSKPKPQPRAEGETLAAWTQPVVPR